MSQPTPFDFMDFKSLLDEDERQIQQLVGRWVDERVAPIIADAFDEHRFPAELVPEMAEMGLLGCNLEGYECAGLNNVSYGLICQELERGDSGLRSFVSVQGSLCMFPIHAWGSEEQKQRYLPKMAKGELIGCFGLTEPDGGSDPGTMKTHAKRDGDDWILNGAKMWITNGGIADVAIVWAMTDDGVRGFLVDKGMKGYTTRDIHNKFSLRASVTSELMFEDVRIPAGNLLPHDKAVGLRGPLSCLNQARYGIAWGAIGAAMACYDEALQYAKERKQFDRPIASFQLVQRKLTKMVTEITKAQLLALRLGQLKDEGKVRHDQVSMAKMNNVEVALKCARTARDILGAAGICDDFQCGRHMCNLESVYTYEGTHDIHTLILGQDITGISAFE